MGTKSRSCRRSPGDDLPHQRPDQRRRPPRRGRRASLWRHLPVPRHSARRAAGRRGHRDRVHGVRGDGGRGVRPPARRGAAALAGRAARGTPPLGPRPHRRGEYRHRCRSAASGRRVRSLPLRDRGGEEAPPHLEKGAPRRWHRPVGGPRGAARGRGTGGNAVIRDRLARPLGSLRVSVTDRCNLRCRYCMPEAEYVWLPKSSLLTFEEIARLTGVFAGLGVTKVRLTGGEPLLRHELPTLVTLLRRDARLADLAMTTNGVLLERFAANLKAAGLGRVTVSLDTLRPERMQDFARSGRHADVLAGIAAARSAGFERVKLNTVVVRGFNDDELADLIAFGERHGAEVRFIEYMDVGGATRWSPDQVVSRAEILERLAARYGPITPVFDKDHPAAPAERFRLASGTTFGIIASVTAPFCASCDRSRLTADGTWFLCLYAEKGVDLREPLRAGASDAELTALIRPTWEGRADRGAEERLGMRERGALYPIAALRADPRREMHTRGG